MTILRDAEQVVGTSILKAHAAETSSTTGSAVDLGPALFQGAIVHVHLTAVGGDADETLDIIIEGSNDNSTWETVMTVAQILQTGGASQDVRAGFDSGKGPKRYYRYDSTQAGTTTTFTYSVVFVGVEPSQAPVTQV